MSEEAVLYEGEQVTLEEIRQAASISGRPVKIAVIRFADGRRLVCSPTEVQPIST